jgi:hypothetical protein
MWGVPDAEKVRLLLARGANVNARSESERTALLVAAAYPGTSDVLRLLLAGGADIRAQDRSGATALAFAVRSADVESFASWSRRVSIRTRSQRARNVRPWPVTIGRPPTTWCRKDCARFRICWSRLPRWQPADWLAAGLSWGQRNATNAAQYGRTRC